MTGTIKGTTPPVATPTRRDAAGVRIEVDGFTRAVTGGYTILDDLSFTVEPGELVAIVGGSGAGKTTLLEGLAGVRPPTSGHVRFDGVDVYEHLESFRPMLGYVPQDDIIHAELPLESTLRYAAQLRLAHASRRQIDDAVHGVMADLNLAARAHVRVSALSGGQRKRASIAVELLTRPRVFFLDEPTSGLDPATDAELMRVLRGLADSGSTVVLTTHNVQDLAICDRIVFLAEGGRLAFVGAPDAARRYFKVRSIADIYSRVAGGDTSAEWAQRFRDHAAATAGPAADGTRELPVARGRAVSPIRQWAVLSRRTADATIRNRLTLAILLGSPVLVVAMFVVLFKSGAFAFAHPSPTAVIMIVFWVTFGGFFFGLTYGLLQVCTEVAILKRERLVGLRIGPYIASKLTVLLPFLVGVVVLMLAVLRLLDRLPDASLGTYASLGVTLLLDCTAALALGLLISAAVGNPSQATLALPMACFPAVLFSGAILPVHVMAGPGRAIATVMPDRWAFEAVGHDLGLRALFLHGGSSLGPPLLAAYGNGAGSHATGTYWLYLIAFLGVFLVGSWVVLDRKCRATTR